jgi:IclR family KDG regulon transcriptional repressor
VKLLASVEKTLRVLEAYSADRQELSTIDLSRLLNIDKSSASRIVVTLQHHGYLSRNPATGKYRLGAKLVDLGNQVLDRYDQLDVAEVAAPFLRELARRIEEVVHLGILDNQEVINLKKEGGGQIVTVDTKVGGRYPAHACALGKVLLAGISPEELGRLLSSHALQRRTPHTIVEVPALENEIRRVREQGYAFEYEESFIGLCCVAAPIQGHGGRVVAAVSATVPKQRSDRARMEEILGHVRETGALISRQIRGTP